MMRPIRFRLLVPPVTVSVTAALLTTLSIVMPTGQCKIGSQANVQPTAAAMQLRTQLIGHKRRINVIKFSPDGSLLVSGGEDGAAHLWNLATGQLKAILRGHKDVDILAFSPNGRTMATGSYEKTIRLWDVETATLKAALVGKKGLVNSIAFSPVSRTVATASLDESIVRLWNVETGALEGTLAHEKHCYYCSAVVWSVAFSPDGRTIATAPTNRKVHLWDAETKKLRMALVDPRLTTISLVRSNGSRDQVETASHRGKIYEVAFSPDGRTLATGGSDGTAKLWDMPTGQLRATLQNVSWKVYPLTFSADSRMLASSSGPTVRLWNVGGGELLATLPHKGTVWSLSFSPDGKLIVTGANNEKAAKVWDTMTGRVVAELAGGRPPVTFSSDGRTLATAGRKGSVLLWDVKLK